MELILLTPNSCDLYQNETDRGVGKLIFANDHVVLELYWIQHLASLLPNLRDVPQSSKFVRA